MHGEKNDFPQHRRDPKVLEGDEKSLGLNMRLPARLPIHRLDLLCHLQQIYVNKKLYLQKWHLNSQDPLFTIELPGNVIHET